MPEGAMSWALGPTVPPWVPSTSSSASPLDNVFDLLMTASPAARQPPRPGLPPVTEGLPGRGFAAEASALPPSLPTLSEHVAEVSCCPEELCALLAQKRNRHRAPPGDGWQAHVVLTERTSVLLQICFW